MLATVVTTGQIITEAFFFAAALACLFGFFEGWGAAPRVWGTRLVYLVLLLAICAFMAWSWPS